jgi:hypothetical protein
MRRSTRGPRWNLHPTSSLRVERNRQVNFQMMTPRALDLLSNTPAQPLPRSLRRRHPSTENSFFLKLKAICVRPRRHAHPYCRVLHHRCCAKPLRAVRWHGEPLRGMCATRWCVPLRGVLLWDSLHSHGLRRCCAPRQRCRFSLVVPRHSVRERPLRRLRRDSCHHPPRRTGGCPSRAHNPSRPRAPCPGRCRCKSTLARRTLLESRRRAHSHSIRTDTPAECRCR